MILSASSSSAVNSRLVTVLCSVHVAPRTTKLPYRFSQRREGATAVVAFVHERRTLSLPGLSLVRRQVCAGLCAVVILPRVTERRPGDVHPRALPMINQPIAVLARD